MPAAEYVGVGEAGRGLHQPNVGGAVRVVGRERDVQVEHAVRERTLLKAGEIG